MPPAPVPLSSLSGRTTESPIGHLIRLALENPALVSLAAGLVDEESLPVAEVAEGLADLLGVPAAGRARPPVRHGPGPPAASRAYPPAAFAAADGLRPEDMGLTTGEVVVTTGSQQLLALVSDALLDPGDIVLTEAPTYFVYQGVLQGVGARVLSVPMDEHGLDTDALEDLLRRLERSGELGRVKLIYTCDYYQNPTGLTLSLERRRKLLELARQHTAERDASSSSKTREAYRELRCKGDRSAEYQELRCAITEYVVWTSTFSEATRRPGSRQAMASCRASWSAPCCATRATTTSAPTT